MSERPRHVIGPPRPQGRHRPPGESPVANGAGLRPCPNNSSLGPDSDSASRAPNRASGECMQDRYLAGVGRETVRSSDLGHCLLLSICRALAASLQIDERELRPVAAWRPPPGSSLARSRRRVRCPIVDRTERLPAGCCEPLAGVWAGDREPRPAGRPSRGAYVYAPRIRPTFERPTKCLLRDSANGHNVRILTVWRRLRTPG